METKLRSERQERMEKEGKKWEAVVVNFLNKNSIKTYFDSEKHNLAQILHKIELDLMSNLHNGLTSPIAVQIREKEK